jgi:hypothetical protein
VGSRKSLPNEILPFVMAEVVETHDDVPSSAWPYAYRYLAYLEGTARRPSRFSDLPHAVAVRIRRTADEYAVEWSAVVRRGDASDWFS